MVVLKELSSLFPAAASSIPESHSSMEFTLKKGNTGQDLNLMDLESGKSTN